MIRRHALQPRGAPVALQPSSVSNPLVAAPSWPRWHGKRRARGFRKSVPNRLAHRASGPSSHGTPGYNMD
eukprot:590292-Pyramimonas_sp.AAC.1